MIVIDGMKIDPKNIAKIAITYVRGDVRNALVARWTHSAVGKLSACASITQDWEIIGWNNEAWFLTGDYTERHNLRW